MIKINTNTNNQALQTTIPLTPTATKSRINASLSITAGQMHAILMASLFVISMVLVPWGTTYAANTAVKWHPGHYYGILNKRKDEPRYLKNVYRELKETPALRGVHIGYRWAELESKKGDYDFTSIDKRLAELAKQKKRLIIRLQTKSFTPERVITPNYLKAKLYEGGEFAFSASGGSQKVKGHNIKLWNNQVRDRLVQLIRAMGKHYNSHPYFEGIGLEETAMGQPIKAISSNQRKQFYDNLIIVNKEMRKSFPNTMTIQSVNYPRPILKSFVGQLKEMGTSLGGPDVRPGDYGLNVKGESNTPDGVYSYYPKLSGIVPLVPSVMPSNYINTRHDRKGHRPTVSELLSFARDELKATHIIWSRSHRYYSKVLETLNWRDQTRDPAGGLDTTCPKKYSSCVK